MAQKRRVLFFIAGHAPTAEEKALAEKIGTKMFRNALHSSGKPERCDAVAGLVPPEYADFPRIDEEKPPPEISDEEKQRAEDAARVRETVEKAEAARKAEEEAARARAESDERAARERGAAEKAHIHSTTPPRGAKR